MSRRTVSMVVISLLLLSAGRVFAGEKAKKQKKKVFTDQVTVTATGEKTPIADVPAAVTVIDRRQMDDAQDDTVADLLRRVPGVTVMRSGDLGSVTSVFTRGTNSTQTLVLFDGVRLNSPYFGGYDFSQLATAGLSRIEMVRGPYSALWGADAVGGVINLVPERGRPGLQGSILTEGGEDSWARFEGRLSYAGHGYDLFLSGSHRDGRGKLINSGFGLSQGLLDLGWSWGEGNRVALVAQDLAADTEIPFTGPTVTPHRHQSSDQTLAAVPITWRISKQWTVTATLAHVERDFSFRDPDDPFGFTRSDTRPNTSQARVASLHHLGRHALTWGGEWRRDTVDDSSSFGTNLSDRSTIVQSAFVQDLWRVTDTVRLLAGARWDDADRWGSQVSPRIGAGWAFAGGWEARVSYGEAFRQPSVGELYFPFSGNPGLRAETSRSWEVGVRRTLSPRIGFELSFFSTHLDDLIDFDFASFAFANITHARIRGAETDVSWRLAEDLDLSAQATWLDTRDEAGKSLLRRPRWSGSITLAGHLCDRLRLDLTAVVMGRRDDVDPAAFERSSAPGFVTADLALAWRVLPGAELTLRTINLFDRRYQEVLGYPAPRQRVLGGVRVRFD